MIWVSRSGGKGRGDCVTMVSQAYLLAANDIAWVSGWILSGAGGESRWLCRRAISGGGPPRGGGLIRSPDYRSTDYPAAEQLSRDSAYLP